MPLTLAQKILASHSLDSNPSLEPGSIVNCRVDLVLANDITAPLAIKSFRAMTQNGPGKVFDKDRVALVMDHFTPQKDIESAEQVKRVREFAAEQGITHYYEGGEAGVEHALLPELGLVGPGGLVVGADSHTCTYGGLGAFATGMGSTDIAAAMALGENWFRVPESILVRLEGQLQPHVGGKDLILWLIGQTGVDGARYQSLEFAGSAVQALSVEGRMTMANMAIEAGAKCGLFAADEKTLEYCRVAGYGQNGHGPHAPLEPVQADAGASYVRTLELDVSTLPPLVACPHLPENVMPVADAPKLPIHQVVIGSCTNGRIEDLRAAASVLKGRKVKKGLRCIILPATPKIWRQALAEGLIEIFMDAGCIVGPASCGPCLGGHLGILAGGERAVSTTNRNFKGRMGSLEAEIYLVNPAIAAATAVAGELALP